MKKQVQLPLADPFYTAYNNHLFCANALVNNPSIRNWFLNESVSLSCEKFFLRGFHTVELEILNSGILSNPYLDIETIQLRHIADSMHAIIQRCLDSGYCVAYNGLDDYYMEGKSWYKQRHFCHDGLICGYDQVKKTYTIYAYDMNWICRCFETPQKCLEQARQSSCSMGYEGSLSIIQAKPEKVLLDPVKIYCNIKEYLDSSFQRYPLELIMDKAYGLITHDYIQLYLDQLIDGKIPYECIERRFFRTLWEHKKGMLERIEAVERTLHLDNTISLDYQSIVQQADSARMLYAIHHQKRRDSVLPTLKDKLHLIRQGDVVALYALIEKIEKVLVI